jgi:phosphoribosylformimino-5-aminoimidazole carboxamide ribonucleotide (ProFAR) isomerase
MALQGKGPIVLPLIYLEKGRVVRPAKGGFAVERDSAGEPVDVFDITDDLFSRFHSLYLIDVDGILSNRPQLDYLQEISRGQEVWVEAGPRVADQVIDVLVAGATRAVLSTDTISSVQLEVKHTLALTDEVALAIPASSGNVESLDKSLNGRRVDEVFEQALSWGVGHFVLTPPAEGWETMAELSKRGKVFVKGVRPEEMESLRASGAAGAVMEVGRRG